MSLSIGIVGLPNVGKSTLFNALTDSSILAANYPFATIEPNTGVVPVPDKRLARLSELYGAQKIIPATVTFVDIAGLVEGASKGEGLGNKFLANIRQCDAIIHVVRAFQDDDVIHVSEDVHPRRDIDSINTELILADLQTIDSHLPKLEKEAKANPTRREELDRLREFRDQLHTGNVPDIKDGTFPTLQLLTTKPVIYVCNVDEYTLTDETAMSNLRELVDSSRSLFICAKLEDELKGLSESDAQELLESYSVSEPGLDQMIHAAYETLGLQSYLTAGEKEIRAWTIPRGATAPQAAGVIHTDFERGFISAQIVDYDDLVSAGSEQEAKKLGLMRTEGKDYVMRPGDIVEFRFNVSK